MKTLICAALLLGAASAAAPPPLPPLCRVGAVTSPIFFPPLRSITLRLEPACPDEGVARVRLRSSSGATDPPNDWIELNTGRPAVTFSGVLNHWNPEWQARSGLPYTIPERSPRGGP